ncbi:hypothetical protein E2C01_057066 [Portunus trituberculatus]|uniref:Integrase p58-like C-terminal domain-containing protein n=1 Tax=Portunus trituberculatus TaxID=210409 RepID=A0A5B7H2B8_PORTR|nr:hypothetical protein [Portunus trituberculatus]
MTATRQRVTQNLRLAGQAMSCQYLQRSRGAQYEVGSLVWLHKPRWKCGLASKLQSPWEGPYTVLAALTDVTYRLQGGPRDRAIVVHVDSGGHFTWEVNEVAGEDRDLVCDPLPGEDRDLECDSLPGEDMDLSAVWPPGEEEGDIVKEVASEPAVSDSDVPRGALPPRRSGWTHRPPAWWRDFIHSDSDSDT